MESLLEEAQKVKDSLEAKEKLSLWRYHLVAPFLGDLIKTSHVLKITKRCVKTLEKNPYPFSPKGIRDRWDAISLLSAFSGYLNTDLIEAVVLLFWENLRFDAPPVRANAALALFETTHRIKSKAILSAISGRFGRIIREDPSYYVKYWTRLALKNLSKPKMVNPFRPFNKPEPITGMKTSRLYHRFLRLWLTGHIEFYQGDYQNYKLPFRLNQIDRLDSDAVEEILGYRGLALPPSYLQFMTDIANGGQLARVTSNLFLLHKQEWFPDPEIETWTLPWITILPANPKWYSKSEDGEEFLPDELGTISISKSLIDSGDEQFGVAMNSYITIGTCNDDQLAINPDIEGEPKLNYFNFDSKTIIKHSVTFPMWINNPVELTRELESIKFHDLA